MLSTKNPYAQAAEDQWVQAHRRAFWSRLLDNVKGDDNHLIDFNTVAQRLNLKNTVYRGVQLIPLDHIVGSVGRYADFTRAFLPVTEAMSHRWQAVAKLQLSPVGAGLPPIEVYKVADWYFVKDGNHRVSVRRQLGEVDIDAHVWEYTDALPDVSPDTDIDTFLIDAERMDFFAHTRLDNLRPDHSINLSTPGAYTEMLYQIAHYQDALSQIDGETMAYNDAVTAWYDMIYEPSVQMIEQDGVLAQFPNRSVADLFIWVMRHHAELAEQCGSVHLGYTIDDIKKQNANPLTRMIGMFRRKLGRG
jgi:hypothetical protein